MAYERVLKVDNPEQAKANIFKFLKENGMVEKEPNLYLLSRFLQDPAYLKLDWSGNQLRIKAYLRMALLPGIHVGKERDITGLVGALQKSKFRNLVAQVESIAQNQSNSGNISHAEVPSRIDQIAPLSIEPVQQNRDTIDSSDEENLKLFAQNNFLYYRTVFERIRMGQNRWNVPAFFLGFCWYGYRKLFKAMAIYFAITVLVGIILDLIHPALDKLFTIGFNLYLSHAANRKYKEYYEKNLADYQRGIISKDEFAQKGGVSVIGGLAPVAIFFLLLLIYIASLN